MHTPHAYDYAVIRVVPRVEREEFVNVGVILSCPGRNFLDAGLHVDRARLKVVAPLLDVEIVEQYLTVIPIVCGGDAAAGPIGRLSARQRFHWLVAPRSTVIQMSPVHSGVCSDPREALDKVFDRMVAVWST